MTFADFDLAPELEPVLKNMGYTTPRPIQEQAVPIVLAGRDLIGCAQTGSGKTAAYMLPVLTILADALDSAKKPPRGPLALVLVPTRELAHQVVEASADFARALDIRITAVYGGVSIRTQAKALQQGVEVIVATPGRLLDHMASGRIKWPDLRVLVLDEADRMLDIGFLPDIRRIESRLPRDRQTLLFSATMPHTVQGLAKALMREPEQITIGDAGKAQPNIPQGITHAVYMVNPKHKVDLLRQLLEDEGMESILIFTRTRAGADRLANTLARESIDVERIHGDLDQKARQKALDGFKAGAHQVLVATDVAARGLDIAGISHVINYDFPPCAEDYIHRVGRTGRSDATGDAVSIVTPAEWDTLLTIEQAIGREIPRLERDGLTYSVRDREAPRLGRGRRRALPTRW